MKIRWSSNNAADRYLNQLFLFSCLLPSRAVPTSWVVVKLSDGEVEM